MQTLSFVGKVYNKKTEEDKKGNVQRVNFRLAVRKKYISDEDKKANKYNVFVPFVAFGKTAELIDEYIEDGAVIGVDNCEYSTFEFENKDGDTVYGHNFKVGNLNFIPKGADDEEDAGSRKNKKSKGKSKRRRDDDDDDDEDEEEEERPRKKKKPVKEEKKKPAKKRRPEPEDDDDDDDDDYEDDVDDEDVPF